MKKIFILLLMVTSLVACNPSQQAYNELESFTEYLENYSASFTDKDWEIAELEYSEIIEKIEANVYTDEQLVQIGKLKGRCAVQIAKYSINNAGKALNGILLETEGFIESLIDGLTDDKTEN